MDIQCEQSKPIDPKLEKIIDKRIEDYCKKQCISYKDIPDKVFEYIIDSAYTEYEAGIK